jgi:hypothetical protein
VLGETTPSLPLYLGSAVLVELVALALIRRPLAFGAAAGAVVGTAGFATEYAWSQLVMPLPWTTDLLPEGLVLSLAAGVAGGLVGALLATGPAHRAAAPGDRPRGARGVRLLVAVGVVAGLQARVPGDVRAQVQLTETRGGEQREATALVRIDPASASSGTAWLTATAWQGGGLVVDRLERVGDGVFRSTRPLRCTATGRRSSACTTAATWPRCRSSCRTTRRSPRPRSPRRGASSAVRRRDRPPAARAQGRRRRLGLGVGLRAGPGAVPGLPRGAGLGVGRLARAPLGGPPAGGDGDRERITRAPAEPRRVVAPA